MGFHIFMDGFLGQKNTVYLGVIKLEKQSRPAQPISPGPVKDGVCITCLVFCLGQL